MNTSCLIPPRQLLSSNTYKNLFIYLLIIILPDNFMRYVTNKLIKVFITEVFFTIIFNQLTKFCIHISFMSL